MDLNFTEFVAQCHASRKTTCPVAEDTITLAFDPGHTTGFAVFHGTTLFESGELDTHAIDLAIENVRRVIGQVEPHIVVMEDYRVYQWKAKHHAGSELLTTRIIGCIETLCAINFIFHVIKQPAHVAKGFCTDMKLKAWNFYNKSEKHARDAIRHGCYFILFGAVDPRQGKASGSRSVG